MSTNLDLKVEEAIEVLQNAIEYEGYSSYNMVLKMEDFFRDSLEGALYAFHQERDHFTTAIERGYPVEISDDSFEDFIIEEIDNDSNRQLEFNFE